MKHVSMHPALVPAGFAPALLTLDLARPFTGQVELYLRGLGDPRGIENVVLVGQAAAASLVVPALEMLGGLPTVVLYGMGKDAVELGRLDLADYRHQVVRSRRTELPRGTAFEGFTVFDGGGRGLTPAQKTELAAELGCAEDAIRVFDVNMGQVDFAHPEKGMIEKVIATGVTFDDLTSGRVLHLPAGSGLVAAVMATTIYGLAEAWPRCIRLASDADKQFHLAEVLDCQAMRLFGAALAGELDAAAPRVTLMGNCPEAFRVALVALAAEHNVEIRG